MDEHAIREYLKTIGNGGGASQETDPVFTASPAYGISAQDIADWNDKQEELVSGTNIKTINGTSILGSGDLQVGGSVTSTDVPTADTISEFDSDAHMNSTDMDAQAVSDFVDGLNVQGGGNEIQTRKLLHTNTTSPFNAQTISLDLTDYDYVEVWFMQGVTSDGLLPNPLQVPIGEFRSIMNVHALLTSGVNENTGGRLVTASTTGITFGNYAYKNRRSGGTQTTANNFAVPHYIYGIKYL